MGKAEPPISEKDRPSHNLVGQRLGRKGRDTRARILAATEHLLAGPSDTAISLSAVAREASLGMTTLYLYFGDLTELLVAVLETVTSLAEEGYLAQLRTRWPDGSLGEHCRRFVLDYHKFWVQHARILHLRNSLADNKDERMQECRILSVSPIIKLFIEQMGGDLKKSHSPIGSLAIVLLASIEHMITITTDESFVISSQDKEREPRIQSLLLAEARLLELGIADGRTVSDDKT